MPMRSHVPRLAWLAAMVVLAGPAFGPATAAAQENARWEISAFAGGFLGSRTYTSEKVDVLMASVPTYGLRLGYRLSLTFSVEARLVPRRFEARAVRPGHRGVLRLRRRRSS